MQEFPVFDGLESAYPSILVGYASQQTLLQLIEVEDGQPVDHAKSAGRIAFACKSVHPIFELAKSTGDVVQTPPLTLPTPGKADVVVTILQDRDGYEICFVEDEAFYELATPTYDAIDWQIRRLRGGDGAPPPQPTKLAHSEAMRTVDTLEELQQLLSESSLPVVVDFVASWCKKCKKIFPFVEKQAQQLAEHAVFLSVDIANAEDIALAYDVTAVPRCVA
jgi:thiol-disulfide isomerase/thioredoxin